MATMLFVSKQSLVLLHREKERTKKLLKFLRDYQDTRDKKKEFATNNVQHKVVLYHVTYAHTSSGDSFLQSANSLEVES